MAGLVLTKGKAAANRFVRWPDSRRHVPTREAHRTFPC